MTDFEVIEKLDLESEEKLKFWDDNLIYSSQALNPHIEEVSIEDAHSQLFVPQ